MLEDAGLPKGVLNYITCKPSGAAAMTAAIIQHPDVKKINFTGSTAIGGTISQLAAASLKPVVLELGGKAPAIVCDDADLELAARHCVLGAFLHVGQICMSTERILLQVACKEEFEKHLVVAADAILGPSNREQILVLATSVARNKALVADAVRKSARILYGGLGNDGLNTAKDTVFRATIVGDVTTDRDIYSKESFGPTLLWDG